MSKIKVLIAIFCIIFGFLCISFKAEAADFNNDSETDIIDSFELYYSKNNTSVIDELNKMIAKYEIKTYSENANIRTKSMNIVKTLSELRSEILDYNSDNNYSNKSRDLRNIVITSAITYLEQRGWYLSAELLAHAYGNTVLYSDYVPINSDIVAESYATQTIANDLTKIAGSHEFVIDNNDEVSTDLYYGIKWCQYEKIYYDSDEITFHLRDCYDFEEQDNMYDSLLSLVAGTMYYYQQQGILTPFITDISVVVNGVVPFSYSISNGNVTIDSISSYVNNFSIPSTILNLSTYVDNTQSDSAAITSIGNYAASYRTNLNSVIIPTSVINVGNSAFFGCSNLSLITIEKANLPLTTLGSNVFSGCSSSLQIKVPDDRAADYKNMTNWSDYNSKIVPIDNNYTTINMTSSTNTTQTLNLEAGYNKLYRLNVIDQGTYEIGASISGNIIVRLFDSSFNLLESKINLLARNLNNNTIYYVSISYQSNTQSGTLYPLFKVHSGHSYDDHYVWKNATEHKSYCACGSYITDFHVVSPDAYQNGNLFATCLLCNGLARFGGIIHEGIGNYPYTLNGSFILPNGIIVLVDEDFEAYMNGTLVFINPNENIDRGNTFVPCTLRKKEDYLSANK